MLKMETDLDNEEYEAQRYRRERHRRHDSSRERRSRNRSWVRNRSRTRDSNGRYIYSGMLMENGVFLNEGLRKCSDNNGQIIIVDSGCPRSLTGDKELEKLKQLVDVSEFKVKDEGFRFGPSRVYTSNRKVKFKMHIGIQKKECEFLLYIVIASQPCCEMT